MVINMKVLLLVLFLMVLARYPQVFPAMYLWHFKEEVRNEVTDLTALAGWKYYSYKFIIQPMFSHHWPSLSMESIPSFFFIWLIVCVT